MNRSHQIVRFTPSCVPSCVTSSQPDVALCVCCLRIIIQARSLGMLTVPPCVAPMQPALLSQHHLPRLLTRWSHLTACVTPSASWRAQLPLLTGSDLAAALTASHSVMDGLQFMEERGQDTQHTLAEVWGWGWGCVCVCVDFPRSRARTDVSLCHTTCGHRMLGLHEHELNTSLPGTPSGCCMRTMTHGMAHTRTATGAHVGITIMHGVDERKISLLFLSVLLGSCAGWPGPGQEVQTVAAAAPAERPVAHPAPAWSKGVERSTAARRCSRSALCTRECTRGTGASGLQCTQQLKSRKPEATHRAGSCSTPNDPLATRLTTPPDRSPV